RRRDALAAELKEAQAAHQIIVDRAQGLRERWLDIRQARIDGMAAELARDLADGHPCVVCGSSHHPNPASPALSAPSPDDELEAERDHEAAVAERESAERALASLHSRHADAVTETSGVSIEDAQTAVDQAEQELTRLHQIAAREPELAAALEQVEAERERVREAARELGETLAARRARLTHLQAERTRLHARLTPAPLPDGPELLRLLDRELVHLREAADREEPLAEEAAARRREREDLQEEARRLAVELAAGRTRQEELSAEAARISARLDEARGDDPTITARLTRFGNEAGLLREALEATRSALAAESERVSAEEAARAAAQEAGFADTADAEAAARTTAELETKAETLRRLDDQLAAVTATLEDPELAAAAAEPAPDLERLATERDDAERARTALASARDRATARAHRLAQL